jgi:hypothetical protein
MAKHKKPERRKELDRRRRRKEKSKKLLRKEDAARLHPAKRAKTTGR